MGHHQPLRRPGQESEEFDGDPNGNANGSTPRYYNQSRWYRPEWNRFTQADRLDLAGGSNEYAYAENDPLSRVDPTGGFAAILLGALAVADFTPLAPVAWVLTACVVVGGAIYAGNAIHDWQVANTPASSYLTKTGSEDTSETKAGVIADTGDADCDAGPRAPFDKQEIEDGTPDEFSTDALREIEDKHGPDRTDLEKGRFYSDQTRTDLNNYASDARESGTDPEIGSTNHVRDIPVDRPVGEAGRGGGPTNWVRCYFLPGEDGGLGEAINIHPIPRP